MSHNEGSMHLAIERKNKGEEGKTKERNYLTHEIRELMSSV